MRTSLFKIVLMEAKGEGLIHEPQTLKLSCISKVENGQKLLLQRPKWAKTIE